MAKGCFYHGCFGQIHAEECERKHSCGVAGMGPLMRASVNPNSQGNMARRTALAKLATEHARRVRKAEDDVLGITPQTLPDVVAMLREVNRMPSAAAALLDKAVAIQRREAVTPVGKRFQVLLDAYGREYRAVVGEVRKAKANKPRRG